MKFSATGSIMFCFTIRFVVTNTGAPISKLFPADKGNNGCYRGIIGLVFYIVETNSLIHNSWDLHELVSVSFTMGKGHKEVKPAAFLATR